MKKLLLFFIISISTILWSSCRNTTNPPLPDDEVPETQLAIIKLLPDMQDAVFVSPIVDSVIIDHSKLNLITLYYGNGLVLCTPTKLDSILAAFAQEKLKVLGTSPYIFLNNGYALVDWKWAHFQPLSGEFRSAVYVNPKTHALPGYCTNYYLLNGTIANEEYYVLPVRWIDLKDLTSIWEIEEGKRIEKPEIRYINVKDIEKYGDFQICCKDICQKYNVSANDIHSTYNLYLRDSTMFIAYVEEYNRLQSLYKETLNQMIDNNDLKNEFN